jgi:hypothetical protein
MMQSAPKQSPRIFALSDLHVHCPENRSWIEELSSTDYGADVLIVGGDVSPNIDQLKDAMVGLKAKFADVLFVPGNHELWVRSRDRKDSIAKFFDVLKLCESLNVKTEPMRVGSATDGRWIVPLFSWYRKPEEGSKSLFVVKKSEDPTIDIWADDHFTKWPQLEKGTVVADIFLRMNETNLKRRFDAPIISFSHFLPRPELMFTLEHDIPDIEKEKGVCLDPHPGFNFSRVAGCIGLDEQIRELGSGVHIYGHQHRNRERIINGVHYISHCLGYPQERVSGQIWNLQYGPLLIWPKSGGDRSGSLP